jgi:hypothetical protein
MMLLVLAALLLLALATVRFGPDEARRNRY